MTCRPPCTRASPAGLSSLAQKNGHSLARRSRYGEHARDTLRLVQARTGRAGSGASDFRSPQERAPELRPAEQRLLQAAGSGAHTQRRRTA